MSKYFASPTPLIQFCSDPFYYKLFANKINRFHLFKDNVEIFHNDENEVVKPKLEDLDILPVDDKVLNVLEVMLIFTKHITLGTFTKLFWRTLSDMFIEQLKRHVTIVERDHGQIHQLPICYYGYLVYKTRTTTQFYVMSTIARFLFLLVSISAVTLYLFLRRLALIFSFISLPWSLSATNSLNQVLPIRLLFRSNYPMIMMQYTLLWR